MKFPHAAAALVCICKVLVAANTFPPWITDAARQPAASYPAKVAQEVLLAEERLTVAPDGRRSMTERGVIRIVQASRNPPVAYRLYNSKSGRIRDIHAWLVTAAGQQTEFDKKRVLDVALDEHGSYEEERAKVIECDANAPAGSVFGYEVTEEEDSIFTSYHYQFQTSSPTAISRFVLSLPPGWEVRGTLLNHADLAPQIAGNTYTWELRGLPWIEEQPLGPPIVDLAPRLGVTYYPANSSNSSLTPLKDWSAVSAWFSKLAEPASEATAPILAKASELTSAARTDLDKIRALASFVQKTNYISVQINLEHGGGYTPHPASDVLSRNYGDCKDKATLLRALLRAAGYDSYPVSLFSGDRDYVRPQWPSPMQFNHAIAAIKLPQGVDSTGVVEVPKLGRLLIFDPTDPYTRLGDLPDDEQGSYALIVAPENGALVQLPVLPPSASRIELSVDGQLSPDGQAQAHVTSTYYGQSASSWRATQKEGGDVELKKALDSIYSRRLGGGVFLDHIALAEANSGLALSLDLKISHFAQNSMDKLLVIKPGSLAPESAYALPKVERKQPIQLSARTRTDRVTLRLPAGVAIDDMPSPVEITSPYGSYRNSWNASGDAITFEQHLELRTLTAPPSEYPKVREFFDKVAGGQYAAVVLLRH